MWHLARRAAALPAIERRLALWALVWLGLARLSLAVMSPRVVRRLFGSALLAGRSRAVIQSSQCADAMRRAVRLLPASQCLPQAWAAMALLRQHGHHAVIRLHVRADTTQPFTAHASVLADGVVVTGAGQASEWPIIFSDPAEL